MSKHILPIGAILVALVVLLAMAARHMTAPQEVAPQIFPEALTERLVLPEQELGELRREIKYANDGLTILSSEVFFVDGSVGYANYQPNGHVGTFGTYYPKLPGASVAQLKMEAEYDTDGTHLIWEKHYSQKGVMHREGKRLDDGNYFVQHFHEDGIRLAGTYVYDSDGDNYSTAEFYDNGVTKKLVKTVDDPTGKTTETTEYSDTGKKSTYVKERAKHIIWETYRPDGVNLVHRFEQKPEGSQGGVSYQTYATYYNLDGSVHHERKFGRYYMYVTTRDAAGEILLYQMWKNKKGGKPDLSLDPDQWILDGVIMGGNIYSDAPSVWFDDDDNVERHVYQVDIGGGATGRVIKVYYPDGSLASWDRPDPANPGKFLETEYEPGESTERFDMAVLKDSHQPVDYVLPPQVPPPSKTYHR